jgi:hypothetical protein
MGPWRGKKARQVLVWPLDAKGCHGSKVVTHDRQLIARLQPVVHGFKGDATSVSFSESYLLAAWAIVTVSIYVSEMKWSLGISRVALGFVGELLVSKKQGD